MIYFNINIRNPAWWDRWANIRSWSGSTPFKHKYWEVRLTKSGELFRAVFGWTVHQDHAGVDLELGVLGYQVDFNLHDSRHWDHDNHCWCSTLDSK